MTEKSSEFTNQIFLGHDDFDILCHLLISVSNSTHFIHNIERILTLIHTKLCFMHILSNIICDSYIYCSYKGGHDRCNTISQKCIWLSAEEESTLLKSNVEKLIDMYVCIITSRHILTMVCTSVDHLLHCYYLRLYNHLQHS